MAHIERRDRGKYRAKYRQPDGRERSRTFARRTDAERWLADQETAKAAGTWVDPSRSKMRLNGWLDSWLPSRESDLRATSFVRLRGVVDNHVRPAFGTRPLVSLGNAEIRAWVGRLQTVDGLSAASTRKAAFALRSALDAAVADRRLSVNPAANVPLPGERAPEQRIASRQEIDAIIEATDPRYRVAVILGGLCGLRWGEVCGLRRSRVDVLRSKIRVCETAQQVDGGLAFGEPKTRGSVRTIPVARSVMRMIEQHMVEHVDPEADALLVTGPEGGAMYRGTFNRQQWQPATKAAQVSGLRFHDLRHSYVSLLIGSGANVKQVSVWAGHSSVTTTLDVYSHLLQDDGDDIAARMDQLLTPSMTAAVRVLGG